MSPNTFHTVDLAEKTALQSVLDDNRTVVTTGHCLVQVIRLQGKGAHSTEDLIRLASLRKGVFDKLDPSISLAFHFHKRLQRATKAPETISEPLAAAIVKKRYDALPAMYTTGHFIVLTKKAPPSVEAFRQQWKRPNFDAMQDSLNADSLSEQTELLVSLLKPYVPTVLTLDGEGMDHLLRFWGYILNGGKEIVAPSRQRYLGRLISLSNLIFTPGEKIITLNDMDGQRYAAFLAIKDYPTASAPKMFDGLYRIKHPFSIMQYVNPQHAEHNKKEITNHLAQIESFRGFTRSRYESLLEAADAVDSGEALMHHHSYSIAVYGHTLEEVQQGIRLIRSEMNKIDIDVIQEGLNLAGAFFAQFPDYEAFQQARSCLIRTDNLADFIPFASTPEGWERCSFGPYPVATFPTISGSRYHFNFHSSPDNQALGHTIIIGGSEAGKTTFIMYVLIECLKYQGLKMMVFDSLNGTRIPITSLGGVYADIGKREGLQLNPLQLPDQPVNRSFLEQWLEMLAGGVNEQEREVIRKAVDDIYVLDPEDRQLAELQHSFGLSGIKSSLSGEMMLLNRIESWWSPHHHLGQIFTAPHDTLVSLMETQRLIGFDMGAILEQDHLLAPLSSYIFHSFMDHQTGDNGPRIWFCDEMVRYFNNPFFGPKTLKFIRETRKKDMAFIGAVQEASTLTESIAGMQALDSIAHLLILPNPTGDKTDYSALGLSDQEYHWVKTTPPKSRQLMVKRRGGESVIIDIDLSSLGTHLRLLSSANTDLIAMDRLQAQYGDQWIEHFLQPNRREVA